ncbi:Fe-S cluster assembly sulfur transfer protein SufU [Paenibacillus senegalensis]|uniref:Fe-S cluster assembly sulfur transfer protein SufU n=1 Tax=Paenibacillus senegalensis TaxID=1465766 RepID=UPI000289AD3B|nr:SUF system NifU family Fe-S cluster assembly protein [Paenibacillus senegalensis]
MKLDDLYRQLVIDHYKRPRNQGKLSNEASISLPYKNPTCGDAMVLYINVEEERIRNIKFEGEGCSISMASCSMMTTAVKGRALGEASRLIEQFTAMVKDGAHPDEEALEECLSLAGVHSLKARHNCALMGWNALRKALSMERGPQS